MTNGKEAVIYLGALFSGFYLYVCVCVSLARSSLTIFIHFDDRLVTDFYFLGRCVVHKAGFLLCCLPLRTTGSEMSPKGSYYRIGSIIIIIIQSFLPR